MPSCASSHVSITAGGSWCASMHQTLGGFCSCLRCTACAYFLADAHLTRALSLVASVASA